MYCRKCGTKIPEGIIVCENCGYFNKSIENNDLIQLGNQTGQSVQERSATTPEFTVWSWMSLTSMFCGVFTLYKGIDKMTNYSSSDYDSINAYVGGDAYNYIINGTYSTAFFVLTTMFVMAAIGFLIVHFLSKNQKKLVNRNSIDSQNSNNNKVNVEDLPDL